MLLECSTCAKMYRLRDGTSAAPTKCPACGGLLKTAAGGGAAPSAPAQPSGPDPRVKELEAKVAALEKSAEGAKALAEQHEQEAREAQASIAKLGDEQAKAQSAYQEALKKKDADLDDRQSRLQAVEAELQKVQSSSKAQQGQMAVLKHKDEQLQELQDQVAQLEEQLASNDPKAAEEAQTKIDRLEQELVDARQNVPNLAAELAKEKDTYSAALIQKEREVDDLQSKFSAIEKQLIEASLKAQAGSPADSAAARADAAEKGSELQKTQSRIAQLERIVQDGERRYSQLQRELDKSAEAATAGSDDGVRLLAEKDRTIAGLNEELTEERKRTGELQKKLADSSEDRKRLQTAVRQKPSGGVRVDEARYLAGDLDKSLGSVSSQLAALVERVKRLHESLYKEDSGAAAPTLASNEREAESTSPDESEAEAESEEAPAVAAEAAASEEEVQTLEMLPEASSDEGVLQGEDETLLDMGKLQRPAARTQAQESEGEEMFEADAGPGGDQPEEGEAAPVDAPTSEENPPAGGEDPPARPTRLRRREPQTEPEKKGFFGKLFGKKK